MQTEPNEMEGDGFVLLVKIFFESDFKEVTTEKFVISLFNSMQYIKDDEIFKAIVWILSTIGIEQIDSPDNVLFRQCLENTNSRFFIEIFISLFNKADEKQMPRCIKFLMGLFKYLKKKKGTKSFFYSNDLRSLIDALIRELGNTSNNLLKK
jgi:hypothetical protein